MSPHDANLATVPVSEPRSYLKPVDGVGLHWVEYGRPGRAPPVLLLHGLSDSHLTWREIAPELARDRRVLVLDLPGHGLSERPDANYELAWYARLVGGWMTSLGLSQVDVVGHSLGGGIALMLLRRFRSRIRRLVLAAPGGLGREITLALRLATLPGIVESLGQPFMSLGAWLALGRWRARLPHRHLSELRAMNARPGTARAFARTVCDLMDLRGQRYSFFRHAHEISDLPPMAVLWGDRDSVIPFSHGKALVRAVEGVKLVEFAGCGHYLHHEDPELFHQAVRDALDAALWPPVRLRATTAPALAPMGRWAWRSLLGPAAPSRLSQSSSGSSGWVGWHR